MRRHRPKFWTYESKCVSTQTVLIKFGPGRIMKRKKKKKKQENNNKTIKWASP